jgi:ABC-type phosphate transport system substrate-binding protein
MRLQEGGLRRGARPALVLILLLLLAMATAHADEEVVVIGHPGLGFASLSEQTVRDLYLGKTVQLSNGTRVEIIDLPVGHPVRNRFYIYIIGRDPGQMRAYWAKRIFTGKGTPPDTRPDERSVVRWVAAAPGRIAYVSADMVDDSVMVLLRQQVNAHER